VTQSNNPNYWKQHAEGQELLQTSWKNSGQIDFGQQGRRWKGIHQVMGTRTLLEGQWI